MPLSSTISSEPCSTVPVTLLMPGIGGFTDMSSSPALRSCARCGWSHLGCFSTRWPRLSYASIGRGSTATASHRPTRGLISTWGPRRRPCCSRHTASGWRPGRSPLSARTALATILEPARRGRARADHLSRPRSHRTATWYATPGPTQVATTSFSGSVAKLATALGRPPHPGTRLA